MKKAVSLILTIAIVLAVFGGCGAAQPGESTAETTQPQLEHVLKVGYGRVDITPAESVPLGGTSEDRRSETAADPLYATCIAFSDENDNTVLLYQLDLLNPYPSAMMSRRQISEATGVPAMQILMAATHNHSGPNLEASNDPIIDRYNKDLKTLLVQAAEQAMADRKPAEMYITVTYPEGLNFLRHHYLADGSKTGWATPAVQSGVAHLFDPDNALQLVKFTREGGKDVLLMNWQGHPDASRYNKYTIRSDVDIVRKELEARLNCQFAYFLGASGNVNTYSYIKGENKHANYMERGKALAQYAIDAVPTFRKVETGKVQIIQNNYAATTVRGTSITNDIQLNAFSVGDVAFITAPYEMFTENGMTIKENSPFAMTVVATCANGQKSYIPASTAFEYDCYEVSKNQFAKGTAEKLVTEYLSMLEELKQK